MYNSLLDVDVHRLSKTTSVLEAHLYISQHPNIGWLLLIDDHSNECVGCLSQKNLSIVFSYGFREEQIVMFSDHPPLSHRSCHVSHLIYDQKQNLVERKDITIDAGCPKIELSFGEDVLFLDWCLKIGIEAQKVGVSIFLVGGAVRDMILGNRAEDLDFLFFGNLENFGQQLLQTYGGEIHVEHKFGALHWTTTEGLTFDFTHARGETYPQIGSLPIVHPSNLFDDLCRRDFATNAMAISITPPFFGSLLDPFDGRGDLQKQTMRVLHGLSFVQDPTRIFRMARYCGRYQYNPDQHSRFLAETAGILGVHSHLSWERIGTEITKIFSEDHPSRIWNHLVEWKIIEQIFPSLSEEFLLHLETWEKKTTKNIPDIWILFAYHLAKHHRETCSKMVSMHKGLSQDFCTIPSEIEELKQKIPHLQSKIEAGWLFSKRKTWSFELLLFLDDSLLQNPLVHWWHSIGKTMSSHIQAKDLIACGFSKGPTLGKALRRSLELTWMEHDPKEILQTLQQEFLP